MQTDQHTLNALARDDAARADAELNRVYGRVAKVLGTQAAALKRAQVAWLAFRDAEVALQNQAFEDGSMREQVAKGTAAHLTRERTAGLLLLLAGPSVLGDGRDADTADAHLNRSWKENSTVEATELEAATRTAQRAWIAFRDAEMALWKARGGNPKAILARLSWERANHLQSH